MTQQLHAQIHTQNNMHMRTLEDVQGYVEQMLWRSKNWKPKFQQKQNEKIILVPCYNGAFYYKENERTPGTRMTLKIVEQKKPDSKNNITFRGTYSLSS